MGFLPPPRADQVPTHTPDMRGRAGARGQSWPCGSRPVRGRLGAASTDTPSAGQRVQGLASEQRDPCLPAGDKMGRGGASPTRLAASVPPLCPWPLTFAAGRNAGRGIRSLHEDGDTPRGQRAAPSATGASINCGNGSSASPDPSLPGQGCCGTGRGSGPRIWGGTHLKHLLVQEAGPKNRHPLGANEGPRSPLQRQRGEEVAIHQQGDVGAFHGQRHAVPPAETGLGRSERGRRDPLVPQRRHSPAIGQVDPAEDGVLLGGRLPVLVLVEEDGRESDLHAQLLHASLVVDGEQEGLSSAPGTHRGQDGEVLGEGAICSREEGEPPSG